MKFTQLPNSTMFFCVLLAETLNQLYKEENNDTELDNYLHNLEVLLSAQTSKIYKVENIISICKPLHKTAFVLYFVEKE